VAVRVLQVDAGREWRGGQNQVRLLTRELRRHPEVDQLLVTRDTGPLAARARVEGVPVTGVTWDMGLDPRAWWGLVRAGRGWRPDIIHVHESHALSLAVWARRWIRPTPRIVAHRRVDFHIRPHGHWFAADAIVAVSDAVRRVLMADGVDGSRVSVIADGIDPDEVRTAADAPPARRFRAELGVADRAPLAVNVAALVGHKDQATLIRAAAAARALRPDLHWAIAGEGPLRPSLLALVESLGLTDRVHLLGYVTEVDALIRQASVFVMSSREEGLGSVVLHALALGTPVVATAAGGLPELVPAEQLVPVGDAARLAQRVVHMLDRPMRPTLPNRFTAAAMAESVVALYRTLV